MNKLDEKSVEKNRKICRILKKVTFGVFVLECILLIVALNMKFNNDLFILSFVSLLFAILLFTVIIMESKLSKKLKFILMTKLSLNLKKFKYVPDGGISSQIFKATDFIKEYNSYSSKEYIEGILENNKWFAMSSILVKKKYYDKAGRLNEIILFDGLFGVVDATNTYTFDLKIVPDVNNKYINQVIVNLRKIIGNTKNTVRLENPEFERFFDVYSDNQIEARKVITVQFMEKLVELRKELKHKITVIYKSSKIYFFIEKGTIIGDKELIKNGITSETINIATDNINKICKTVNLL